MSKYELYFVKAEQGERSDNSIIYQDQNGNLVRYLGGHWNWRANNPGNIHVSDISRRHNQIGVVNKGHCINLAIFPTSEVGKEALVDCLHTHYSNLSLHGLAWKYAPEKDGNDPASYEAHLRRATGIKDETPVRNFTVVQFQKLVVAIPHEEGRKTGQKIEVHKILHVHKNGNEIIEYYLEGHGWITKEKCIELARAKELDAYVEFSKLGNPYVRARTDSSFQDNFENLVEKKK